MQHFKNALKIHQKQKFNCLVLFKMDGPVCNYLNVKFINKTTLKTIFSFKKSIFVFLTQKKL